MTFYDSALKVIFKLILKIGVLLENDYSDKGFITKASHPSLALSPFILPPEASGPMVKMAVPASLLSVPASPVAPALPLTPVCPACSLDTVHCLPWTHLVLSLCWMLWFLTHRLS